jgi:hypothetical protein
MSMRVGAVYPVSSHDSISYIPIRRIAILSGNNYESIEGKLTSNDKMGKNPGISKSWPK